MSRTTTTQSKCPSAATESSLAERYGDGMKMSVELVIFLGTGTSVTVTPVGSTNYYVRGENGTCYSNCKSCPVTILGSQIVGVVTSTPNPVCSGQTSTLSLTGTLYTGGQWYWYLANCGTTYLGTGATFIVSPTTTTNYYVRQENLSTYSSCANVLVERRVHYLLCHLLLHP